MLTGWSGTDVYPVQVVDGILRLEGTPHDDVAEVRIANGKIHATLSNGVNGKAE